MSEILPELLKDHIDDLRLHLGRELLIEVKLLNDQIVIVLECLFDCLRNVQIQVGWDVEVADRRVSQLHFLDPEVKLVCLYHEHSLEVNLGGDQRRDETR